MSTVDALLAQSLLLHQPHVPSDVVSHDDLDYTRLTEDFLLRDDDGPDLADDRAAQSLTALCEAVVAHCTIDQFADFLTEQVPQPRAAWILGCTLQLAGADDGARFWWQYAAGAGDVPAASYCLYLQHLARGDTYAAALWQDQAVVHPPQDGDTADTDEQPPACQVMTADTSLATLLRVLSRLSRTSPRTQAAQAVIEFVAASVTASYDQHPDLEFPVLGPEFVEQLVIVAASLTDRPDTTETVPAEELPNRSGCATGRLPAPGRRQGPERLLVEVTADGHERASARMFFKEAVAVCWEKAILAGSANGTAMAYYLKRFRARAALARSPASAFAPNARLMSHPHPCVRYSRS
ncbi:hypothetical protein ACFVYR_36530 [Streptomyces sp. NPDC058284]|uniref:hypothetical protein n=1 Tax=unclassified Streptomyces TaxID=2593676 RepID=UPI003661CA46